YRQSNGKDLESLSHVVGFLGRVSPEEYATLAPQRYRASDMVGKTGIESAYEARLRGTSGIRTVLVDARGRIVATPAVAPPVAGQTVPLSIDLKLQETAERALRAGIGRAGARRGAAIAMDPHTGEILALVSVPAFSSSALAAGLSPSAYAALVQNADHPLFPRAIAGTYPSGSTIKPVVAAAALSTGVVTPQTRVLSTGGLRVGASFFPDWQAGGHGWVSVTDALAQSVNTFFYVVGGGWPRATAPRGGPQQADALGPDRLAESFRAFGFGIPTGIDLPGEVSGFVPTPTWKEQERGEPWYIGDTYHLAIGQGDLLATPLQIAVATAAFANEGRRVVPRLVSAFVNQGSSASGEENQELISGITGEAINVVRQGMRLAVTNGSARGLADLPFFVAGKTGTAQTTPNRRPHAWFTGFAEARSAKPQATSPRSVVITVLVEEGGEGSHTAVPIAREILSAWAQ
ncbi:MAG: penicillin-binding transpeptidase domain-containing protein, partial [bacterium]|nr:penicillin-binding transpeptidase domain-containing protein [bacterium]